MSRLAITQEILGEIRTALLDPTRENAAVLLGREVVVHGRLARLVVREMVPVPEGAYLRHDAGGIEIRPEFVAEIARRVRETGESVVWVHTHTGSLDAFTSADDAGEKLLGEFFGRRTPGVRHASLLLTPTASIARVLATDQQLLVCEVGPRYSLWTGGQTPASPDRYERQTRLFGEVGQRKIAAMRVGVVGLGGTGSMVLEQLAHLGVRDFVLLDPDVVEVSNLSRIVGASQGDIGRPKADVAASAVARINPAAKVSSLTESALRSSSVRDLADVDVVFCCTDSEGSRAVLNQFAYQYLVPIYDIGTIIDSSNGEIRHVGGRAQMLSPGVGCLVCGNLLNPENVRRDLMSDFERRADPYIRGGTEPAPAVISLNGAVVSLAMTMFLQSVVGIPGDRRYVLYDAVQATTRPIHLAQLPQCIVCSREGALARADEWPLPGRKL